MAGTAAPDQQEAHLAGNDPEDSGQGLAKDAIGQGADLVMATGGDGTVMACATALARLRGAVGGAPAGDSSTAAGRHSS
jgi:diacylglycerol kinase (ATP)